MTFKLAVSLLAYTGMIGELVMEPGAIKVSEGSSSSDIRSTRKIEITGKTRTFEAGERAFLSVATIGAQCQLQSSNYDASV